MSAVETSLLSGSSRWASLMSLLKSPLLPLLLILTALLLLPATLSAQAEETQKDDPKAPAVTATDQSAELAKLVREKLAAIPDPRTLKREDLAAVFIILDEGIDAGRDYVSQFEDGGKEFSRVAVDLGRLLILNVDRHVGMLAQAAKESGSPMTAAQRLAEQIYYLQEVVDLANSALAAGDLSLAQQCRARVVLGDALLKCRKQKEAAAQFGEALKLDTSEIDLDELRIKEVEALELAEDYEAMVKAGMNCLENHPRSPYLPHLVYFTHKACRHLGKLTQGRNLWRKWGPVLTAGSKAGAKITLPGREEEPPYIVPEGKETDFAMMADRQGFYEGFYQLALGEKEAALQAMLKFNDDLYERINTGETLAMPTKTYFEFQSVPMAQRIDVLHDREAPSLEGMTWAQKNPADENSKIELRIFCDSSRGNNRQNRFLDVAKELEQEFSSEGLSVVWISGILREDRADREIASMKSLAASKNLGWTFGVQAGQEKGILDRHLVSHGGTLLFIIDKDKKVRWEVIDPMFWDKGLYRSVIRRLLAEGS
ncbi:MAG: hypothetical protein ACPHP7_02425 [Planctomycetota bacterium]